MTSILWYEERHLALYFMGLLQSIPICTIPKVISQVCCFVLFIQHNLYFGVVEKPSPPPLTGVQYGNMQPKYNKGGHCQSGLRPPLFLIIPCRRQRQLTWTATHYVVSREINLWNSFDLLLGSSQSDQLAVYITFTCAGQQHAKKIIFCRQYATFLVDFIKNIQSSTSLLNTARI